MNSEEKKLVDDINKRMAELDESFADINDMIDKAKDDLEKKEEEE